MTLQERLRVQYNLTAMDEFEESADALDAQEARIKALEGALRETLECLDGCMVFINTREKINQQEGPNWIAGMTASARALLGEK